MSATAVTQLEIARMLLRMNLEGVTHEESLIGPAAGGNCLNWVVGHLVTAYNNLLPGIGGQPVWDEARQAVYDRGAEPITAEAALPLEQLLADYEEAHARVVGRIAELTDDELAAPAHFSPIQNPDETIGSLIDLVAFHQSYHTGQTGLLRRIAGHEGAAP